jgi:hypothetical protein
MTVVVPESTLFKLNLLPLSRIRREKYCHFIYTVLRQQIEWKQRGFNFAQQEERQYLTSLGYRAPVCLSSQLLRAIYDKDCFRDMRRELGADRLNVLWVGRSY